MSCLLTGDDGGNYRFQRLPPHRVAVIRRGPTQARSERLRGILEKLRSNVGRAPAGESTRSTAQNFPPQETEVKPKYKGHLRRTALDYANLAYPPGCIHIEAQNMKRHSSLYSNWIIPAREPHHHDSSAHTEQTASRRRRASSKRRLKYHRLHSSLLMRLMVQESEKSAVIASVSARCLQLSKFAIFG